MKKILALILALVALLMMAAVPAMAADIALVTDDGTIDDESFNQACWEGVKAYAEANGLTYQYYQPAASSTDERLASMDQAVSEGAKIIVCPGYLFGEALATAQDIYPDTKFVGIDMTEGDMGVPLASNVYLAVFGEEQAGYMAGYAVVKDGYTKLGFLGGIAVPAVQRFGYGFVQGANAAAVELGIPVEINYTYGGQFFGDANITAKMEGWYSTGTEIVFACGGGIWTSAVEAAMQHKGFVVGVDTNQYALGRSYEKDYGYNPFVTSAMKGLTAATETALDKFFKGEWETIGGQQETLNLQKGESYVGLPMADESWGFKTFTKDEATKLAADIASGAVVVSAELAEPAVDANVKVNYID